MVAVELGPGLQAGQVRAGVGLAEQLTIRIGAGDHARQMTGFLFVAAVDQQRRPGHSCAEPDRTGHRPEFADGPDDNAGFGGRLPLAEPCRRPVRL